MVMRLTSALLMILLWALASGPVMAGGGQSQSFGRSASPMFHGNHFHPSVHSGFVVVHNGHFHSHFHHRPIVIVGAPFFGPFYYPYPYYYYPPMSYLPPDYMEGGGAAPGPSEAYWYYCAGAKAYYPYVKECPGGWQKVAPQPPPASAY